MRASEIYAFPVQTSAFQASPLQQRRELLQRRVLEAPPAQPRLDTTSLPADPVQQRNEQARIDLMRRVAPLCALPEAASAQHTPGFSRGQYAMATGPGLDVQVELGVLLWQHAERGAPGSLGRVLDHFV